MKILCLVLAIVGALADKAPYPPSGWKPSGNLLLLPQQEYGPPPTSPTQGYGPPPAPSPPQGYGPPAAPSSPPQEYGPPPSPPQEYGPPQNATKPEEDDLDKVNERIMERLRQEEGSDTGVYYVYLPDGRLQRVQYTSAPLKAPPQQNQQSSYNVNFLQNNQQTVFGNHQVSTQQANSQSFGSFAKQQTSYDAPPSGQYSQASFQTAQFSQYKQQGSARYDGTSKVSKNNQQVELPGSPSQIFAKYQQPTKADLPQAPAKLTDAQEDSQSVKYVASVSYSDVAPITGPIYTYASQPLVRVLRYAPMFQ